MPSCFAGSSCEKSPCREAANGSEGGRTSAPLTWSNRMLAAETGLLWGAVVQPNSLSEEHRTALFPVVADRQRIVEFLARELIDLLRVVRGNVDADFLRPGSSPRSRLSD